MSLFRELKRRKLFRVVIAYVVGAWVFVQVADLVADNFNAPDWVMQMIIALLVVGLPVSLILAWAFDRTPDGVVRTLDLDTSQPTLSSVKAIGLVGGMFAVVTVILYLIWPQTSPPPMATGKSIAVLPFLNLSSDTEQEYFSDGLADTLLHRLTQIKDLRVAARTSSFKFKGQNEDMRDIARQLGVATVLEGSVQRQGDRVRITAQLIDGSDGSHIWSQVFDDTLDDIFRVQDEIAHNVARAMQATLGDTLTVETDLGGTDNVAAYDAYLKGVEYRQRGSPEAASHAVVQLELAIELDPDYARAWVALSGAYALLGPLGTVTGEQSLIPAMHAAERAVALAPNLPEAHLALANILLFEGGDAKRAAVAIEEAAELGPNNAESLAWLGWWRHTQGLLRDGLRYTERAALINPLDPGVHMQLAFQKLTMGLEDEAIALARSVTESNPGNLVLLINFQLLLQQNQQWVEAARATRHILKSDPDSLLAHFILSDIHLRVGDIQQADEYMLRAEAISPDRAVDNRRDFCLLTGDLECYSEYAERYLQLRRSSGFSSLEIQEGMLRLYEGDYMRAIELLQPRVGDSSAVTDHIGMPQQGAVELHVAVAYDKIGDTRKRDTLLENVEQEVRELLANGLSIRFARHNQLKIAAIRGDAQHASEILAAAIDASNVPQSGELEHYIFYDSVREHPDFQAQLARARAREAEISTQLSAEKL